MCRFLAQYPLQLCGDSPFSNRKYHWQHNPASVPPLHAGCGYLMIFYIPQMSGCHLDQGRDGPNSTCQFHHHFLEHRIHVLPITSDGIIYIDLIPSGEDQDNLLARPANRPPSHKWFRSWVLASFSPLQRNILAFFIMSSLGF